MVTNNDDILSIGLWNPDVAADVRRVATFNLTADEIKKDQIMQLYLLLYPYISAEFSHRTDVENWAEKQKNEFKSNFDKLNAAFNTHKSEFDTHIHQGNLGSPVTPPTIKSTKIKVDMYESLPKTETFGDSLVVNQDEYSSTLLHRDISKHPEKVTSSNQLTPSIVTDYRSFAKYTPFDVSN